MLEIADMPRVNTILRRVVPIFLFSLLCLSLSCGDTDPESEVIELTSDETFVVEQYLRLVEARQLSAAQDESAESVWAYLTIDFPSDSVRIVTARITERDPERWPLVFEEIVRRKKLMLNRP